MLGCGHEDSLEKEQKKKKERKKEKVRMLGVVVFCRIFQVVQHVTCVGIQSSVQ